MRTISGTALQYIHVLYVLVYVDTEQSALDKMGRWTQSIDLTRVDNGKKGYKSSRDTNEGTNRSGQGGGEPACYVTQWLI